MAEMKHSGVMVALKVPDQIAQEIAQPGGEAAETLHLTLCYIPGIGGDEEKKIRLQEAIAPLSTTLAPLMGCVGGIGRFNGSETSEFMDVFYASYNSPGLEALRTAVVKAVTDAGFEPSRKHGFTPHITLKYLEEGDPTPELRSGSLPFAMDCLCLGDSDGLTEFQFTGSIVLKGKVMKAKEIALEHQPEGPQLVDAPKGPKFQAGEVVTVNAPMDPFFGRKGVIEYVSPYDSGIAVRFADGARQFYVNYQLVGEQKEEKKISRLRFYRDVKKSHDWANIENIRNTLADLVGALDEFFGEEEEEGDVDKGSPTSSQVHVPSTDWNTKKDMLGTPGPEYRDPDANPEMYPSLDNLESEILKTVLDGEEPNDAPKQDPALGEDEQQVADEPGDIATDLDQLQSTQLLIEGMDWELEHSTVDPDVARENAIGNLEQDPAHYRKLEHLADRTDDVLAKDTQQTEEDPFSGMGFNLDLGSGQTRQPGYLGLDLFPYDHGTIVHDLSQGIPFPDGSVSKVRMTNSLHAMEGVDPKAIMSEIYRVLMPGGQFLYEGPNEIYNAPQWAEDYPDLVLTNHEDGIKKADSDYSDGLPVRQQFQRLAEPDPATANDAEPRIGVGQYDDLSADAFIAADALSYYYSDATSSGRGNRLHGYPSQGALVDKDGKKPRFYRKDQEAEGEDDTAGQSVAEQQVQAALSAKLVNPPAPKSPTRKSRVEKMLKSGKIVPILKADSHKQIVYGVVLAPNEIDAQDDFMEPEEIEKAAHRYLTQSRVIGSGHSKPIQATPVESFIAPQDFDVHGQYGPQPVKKGSWVLGVKVHDPEEWQKIVSGEYTGFSVGGLGLREQT